MNNDYYTNLIKTVIDNSESNNWENAVYEWEIIDRQEDENQATACICGKENLKYLYTIQNQNNGNILKYIGSTCIKKFDRDELNKITNIHQKLSLLYPATENRQYIKLDSTFFSRNILKYLFDEGAFITTSYNKGKTDKDYEFMLQMFNSRKKPSQGQQSMINGIIIRSIIPFLQKELKSKII